MSEKRMLIVPAELGRRIDDNRGDMSQAEFIDFLIDSCLKEKAREEAQVTKEEFESLKQEIKAVLLKEEKAEEESFVTKQEAESLKQEIRSVLLKEEKAREQKYATKEEIQSIQQDTRRLLKSFLDFFIGYGLEVGKQAPGNDLKELAKKLEGLEDDLTSEEESKEVKIKWK